MAPPRAWPAKGSRPPAHAHKKQNKAEQRSRPGQEYNKTGQGSTHHVVRLHGAAARHDDADEAAQDDEHARRPAALRRAADGEGGARRGGAGREGEGRGGGPGDWTRAALCLEGALHERGVARRGAPQPRRARERAPLPARPSLKPRTLGGRMRRPGSEPRTCQSPAPPTPQNPLTFGGRMHRPGSKPRMRQHAAHPLHPQNRCDVTSRSRLAAGCTAPARSRACRHRRAARLWSPPRRQPGRGRAPGPRRCWAAATAARGARGWRRGAGEGRGGWRAGSA